MKTLATVLVLPLVALGCAYPTTMVNTVDDRPRITIVGAPKEAELYVDGIRIGQIGVYPARATALDGALVLESGTHQIEVVSQGQTVHSERVFLGEGTYKEIRVHGSGD